MKSIRAFRTWRESISGPVVLVPTMGALHRGHAALIRHARKRVGGSVVVSIFVNPTQFGPKEDFLAYPRSLSNDLCICRELGVDAVFVPSVETMYASDHSASIDETFLSHTLCGKSRPGHFRGVCTVVAKLFLIIQPTAAIFGEKDWQQLAIIRRMVRDLNFSIRILGYQIVREADGLAMSSRNAYLTPKQRERAPRIYAALCRAVQFSSPTAMVRAASRELAAIPDVRLDYVEAVDAETLQPLTTRRRTGRLAAAIFLGSTRLIDNIPIPQRP